MIEHVNYLKTLSEHLEAVNDPVAEKDLIIILISSLLEKYNYLINALDTITEERLTWDYVHDKSIHEHKKLKGRNTTTVKEEKDTEALFSSRSTGQRKIPNSKKVKCFYCQKRVTLQRTVTKKIRQEKGNKRRHRVSKQDRSCFFKTLKVMKTRHLC